MLTFYGSNSRAPIAAGPNGVGPDGANWIDAFEPTPGEVEQIERLMGVRVPTLADLSEIETSSRLSAQGQTLFMSLPATVRDDAGFPHTTPVGFVLDSERLVTLRFAHLPALERVAKDICARGELGAGGLGATVSLLEMIVDQLADVLERVGGELDDMSRRVFANGLSPDHATRPQRDNRNLSRMLKTVGRNGDFVSKVNDSLLTLSRIVPFLGAKAPDLLTPEFRSRLDVAAQDGKSLREFADHLANKTQFLLDALLGLANIEQNNVFRVLTVVSVVGIPPTFIASMYGMNFKNMPEYDWAYGYQYGLTLIVLSALLPAIWFKIKGWW